MPALGPISEKSTFRYSGVLADADGNPVPLSAMESLTLTWYEQTTGDAINGRSHQNVLNANNVTMDEDGNIIWFAQAADTLCVTTLQTEIHVAEFYAVWNTGSLSWQDQIPIRNLRYLP